jgi:hypothetical protein
MLQRWASTVATTVKAGIAGGSDHRKGEAEDAVATHGTRNTAPAQGLPRQKAGFLAIAHGFEHAEVGRNVGHTNIPG